MERIRLEIVIELLKVHIILKSFIIYEFIETFLLNYLDK